MRLLECFVTMTSMYVVEWFALLYFDLVAVSCLCANNFSIPSDQWKGFLLRGSALASKNNAVLFSCMLLRNAEEHACYEEGLAFSHYLQP